VTLYCNLDMKRELGEKGDMDNQDEQWQDGSEWGVSKHDIFIVFIVLAGCVVMEYQSSCLKISHVDYISIVRCVGKQLEWSSIGTLGRHCQFAWTLTST